MCHEGAGSQLGGPSVEHFHSSSVAGETWIHTGSIPAMSASHCGEPDFLDHRESIPALKHLYNRDVISTELISPSERYMEIDFMMTCKQKKCVMLKLGLIMGRILFIYYFMLFYSILFNSILFYFLFFYFIGLNLYFFI